MATLEKIRSNTVLLITVIAVALFAFIIGDGLRSGSSFFQKSKEVVLNINGEKISIHEYQDRLKVMEQAAEQQGQKLNDEQRMMLNNRLMQEFVTNEVLKNVSEAIGMKVRPAELYALIRGEGVQPSPAAQQFFSQFGINTADPEAVNGFIRQISDNNINSMPAEQQPYLRQIQQQWNQLQQVVLTTRLQEKLGALLSRSYAINKVDLELEQGKGARNVAFVRSASTAIDDNSIKISDDEIKKYYDEHKEFFAMKFPSTQVNYINMKVVPSADDYKTAAAEKDKAVSELANSTDVENAIRTFNEKFYAKTYFTAAELEQFGMGTDVVEFIKTAAPGAVNNPEMVSDRYNIVKLVGKKSGPASVNVRLIALDSAMSKKADSLYKVLEGGADFAEMAKKYSVDPQTREEGGLLSFPDNYGMPHSEVTESAALNMGIGDIYSKPVGSIVRMDQPNGTFFLKAEKPTENVEKYQFAYVGIPVIFSDKTYNEKYSQINNILIAGGKFEDMAKKAEAAGISVKRNAVVSTQSAQLDAIPDSREIVSWAIKAGEGEIGEKLFRSGSDNLVIASVAKQLPAGYAPLDDAIKEQIKSRLMVDKRGEKLVATLKAKNLATLDAYAEAMGATIDSLVDVSYQVRGSEAPQFNAYAMTTAVGKVSAPFVAGSEVMVVQPLAEVKRMQPETLKSAATMQRRADLSRQMSYRAFNFLIQDIKIEDNRSRFY